MRVLYVIPGTEEGAGMSFSRRQAASVAACGVEVHTFYLRSRTSIGVLWSEYKRLRAEIKCISPDVVHAHFGTMTGFVAAMASPVPLVVTFHGSDLNPAPGVSRIRSLLGRALSHISALRANHVICVSPQLRGRIGYKKRAHTIPCGVNTDLFRPMDRGECRRRLGWRTDEKVVVFNARTDPRGKRLDLAEAAVEYASRDTRNIRLHVFNGTTHPDEMPIYYGAADVLLMASDFEGSPMVIKEAMACNLPVVSVDVGDVRERLADSSPSAVVGRDPSELGRALLCVLNENRHSNGRDVISPLSERHVAKRVTAVYTLATSVAGAAPRMRSAA